MKKFFLMVMLFSCSKLFKGTNFKNKNINEELLMAVINSNKEKAKNLIKKGANLKFIHKNKNFLEIALSLEKPKLEMIKILIKEGMQPTKEEVAKIYNLALTDFDFNSRKIIDLMYEKNYKIAEGIIDDKKYFLLLCYKSNIENVEEFLKVKNVNVKEIKDNYNNNALTIACEGGNKDIVELLIDKGILIDDKDEYDFTPLMIACDNGYENIVELLTNRGANIDKEIENGWTALILAVRKGFKEIIKILIDRGADINKKENQGVTALMLATQKGYLEIAKFLIEKGANVNDTDKEGFTPLILASQNGYIEIVELLIKEGANINKKNNEGFTPLMAACEADCLEIVDLLIVKGSDLESNNRDGATALMIAVKKNQLEIVKLLIEKGADVNSSDYNKTALILAFKKNMLEISKFLIKKGANINLKDINKKSALYYAVMNENIELIKELVEAGIDIYGKDELNRTILNYISEMLKIFKDKSEKDKLIEISYMIVRKISEEYIQLFISLNKNTSTIQEIKDNVHNHINLLYFLQNLPIEIFENIIKNF